MVPSLLSFLAIAGASDGPAPPTFAKDVAPILWANCAGCHRPGEVGPFSLLGYADAAKRADFLAELTASRAMPPWKAEPGYGSFHDERRLTDDQIATIAAWAEAGAPEGDPADLPARPEFPEGWQLGEPDLVLEMPADFHVPADGPDLYRCFVLPTGIESDAKVAAVEFRPGNRKVVHHALFFLDSTGAGRRRDAQDEAPGYASYGGIGIVPTGGLGGWAPGANARVLPAGHFRPIAAGSDLVMQVHYHPSGKPETDRSKVGIHFVKGPATKQVYGLALRSRKIDIPPGAVDHRVSTSLELPVAVTALGIAPHMHQVGRQMKVTATLPDGEVRPLIWIKDWDFNWQGQYGFAEPVRLPAGTRLDLEAIYDNSTGNPRNPSDPPKRVTWGEQTTDEMCLCGIQVTTDRPGDYLRLLRAMGRGIGEGAPDRGAILRRLFGGD